MSALVSLLTVLTAVPPSEMCMRTIDKEEGMPSTVTLNLATTMNYCDDCDYDKIAVTPSETDSELPSQFQMNVVDGCVEQYMRCFRTDQTVCLSISLNIVTDTSTMMIGVASTTSAYGTVSCNKEGYWEYEGTIVNRVYCLFSGCL
ncbi:unnamed protein product [Caenorhabditis sp. 36 PRJEB53466]|nr:unnamed protein product [Caenorhabditis sp. 36 PRJEB53466]